MPERNHAVYQAIKARAITYALPPGRRILLGPLAENLNTTRHQVREALLRLVTEGWALQAPNKGFLAIGLDATTVAEYHDVNLSLLTSALRAAESRKPMRTNALTMVDRILRQLNRNDRDNECLATLIGHLFYAIAALGGNQVAMQLVERCNEHLYFIRTQECQYFVDAAEELMALCELAVGPHFAELKQAIIDYHNRRNRASLQEVRILSANLHADRHEHSDSRYYQQLLSLWYKQQIAGELQLEDRILVGKATALLLLAREGKIKQVEQIQRSYTQRERSIAVAGASPDD